MLTAEKENASLCQSTLLPPLFHEPLPGVRAHLQQDLEDVLPPRFDLGVIDLSESPEQLLVGRHRHRQIL
jgi:hypothetical protein